MGNVVKIHKLKLLRDVRNVLLDDIVATINIINERIDVPAVPFKYENTVELQSIVTGHEGFHPIISLHILLDEDCRAIIQIEELLNGLKPYEIKLAGLDLIRLLEMKERRPKLYKRNASSIITDMIQSERMDIDDIVGDIFERAYKRYEIGGVLKRSSGLL